jgi:hypothetical protein
MKFEEVSIQLDSPISAKAVIAELFGDQEGALAEIIAQYYGEKYIISPQGQGEFKVCKWVQGENWKEVLEKAEKAEAKFKAYMESVRRFAGLIKLLKEKNLI